MDRCLDCRFYAPEERSREREPRKGECLRFPPVPLVGTPSGVWPTVRPGDVCGEFQRKGPGAWPLQPGPRPVG